VQQLRIGCDFVDREPISLSQSILQPQEQSLAKPSLRSRIEAGSDVMTELKALKAAVQEVCRCHFYLSVMNVCR
jgi:hypothetical protein